MRLAGLGVESFSDDAAVADDDAAHHRVGAGVAGRLARQLHAPPHVVSVVQVPRRLRLAAPAEGPGHEAGAGSGGERGGADRALGEVRARDERGRHARGRRAVATGEWRVSGRGGEPNPRAAACARGEFG